MTTTASARAGLLDAPSNGSAADRDAVTARRRRPPAAVVAALLLALLGTLAVLASQPPSARGQDAPASEFSAARATEHLREIARRPHPVGSAEHARVREYLVRTARGLGAEVSVQSGQVAQPGMGSPFPSATVHNVVARLPGRGGGAGPEPGALLFVAHYDSVPTGPGAADNGAAVAAMLETLRAVQASGGVRSDLVLLFTDGEELGALGAELFVREEGLDDYAAVFNWEARGSGGPLTMFETGEGNLPLVDAFAEANPRPVATSLAYEIYKRLPNDSDFTVFRDEAAGLNSAFIEGFHDYHSRSDTVDSLDPDSLQHHGETMLGLARELDGAPAERLRGEDGANGVYFDLFARLLVRYPVAWAAPLAGGTLVLLAGVLVLGVRRRALRPTRVAAAAGAGLGALLAAGAAVHGLWTVALLTAPDIAALPLAEPYNRGWFAASFGVAVGAVLLGTARLLRRLRPAESAAGTLLTAGVLLAALTVTLPGAGYLVQWPLLAALPALWWTVRRAAAGGSPEAGGARTEWTGVLLWSAGPAVAVVLFLPLAAMLLTALGVPLASVAAVFVTAGLVTALPLLARLPATGAGAAGAAALALVLLGGAVAGHGYGAERPRPNSLLYVRDAAEDRNLWFSADPAPDAWTRRVLGGDPGREAVSDYFPPRGDEPAMVADAPALDVPLPEVTVRGDATRGDVRTVRFTVESQRPAWRIQVRLPRAPLNACTVGETRLDRALLAEQAAGAEDVVLHHYGARSVEVTCEVTAGTRLRVDAADYTLGLTPQVRELVGPRPRDTVPVGFGFLPEDSVIARTTEEI
ncbi:M20/M25/M40 family metallo-hydrolase [Streptomyces sp. NPDC018321]|uniref:M20/M25/M40 family metallo-hydrolase n=1 Tax=unclassified Streptomyces TaxID=2593676 RepID=UPI0037BC7526